MKQPVKHSVFWLEQVHFRKLLTDALPLWQWEECQAIFKTLVEHEIALGNSRQLLAQTRWKEEAPLLIHFDLKFTY
jgi:hypothetical protein